MVLFGALLCIPDLASFTTPDPYAHGGSTQCSCARGDPINLVDPTGLPPRWWSASSRGLDNLSASLDMVLIGAILLVSLIPVVGQGCAAHGWSDRLCSPGGSDSWDAIAPVGDRQRWIAEPSYVKNVDFLAPRPAAPAVQGRHVCYVERRPAWERGGDAARARRRWS